MRGPDPPRPSLTLRRISSVEEKMWVRSLKEKHARILSPTLCVKGSSREGLDQASRCTQCAHCEAVLELAQHLGEDGEDLRAGVGDAMRDMEPELSKREQDPLTLSLSGSLWRPSAIFAAIWSTRMCSRTRSTIPSRRWRGSEPMRGRSGQVQSSAPVSRPRLGTPAARSRPVPRTDGRPCCG